MRRLFGSSANRERTRRQVQDEILDVLESKKTGLRKFFPSKFWIDQSNQTAYLSSLGKELGITEWTDWYKITAADIKNNAGASLISYYEEGKRSSDSSDHFMYRLLSKNFPEHPWITWNFRLPLAFWNNEQNQLRFLKYLEKKLEIKDPEDWYRFQVEDVLKFKGNGLISRYNHSLQKMLDHFYPGHDWKTWKFARVKPFFWDDRANQLEYIEWLEKELNIKQLDDWYNVHVSEVVKKGGSGLLGKYEGSLHKALLSIYPDFPWKHRLPAGALADPENVKELLSTLEKSLCIAKAREWYEVSQDHLAELRGSALLRDGGFRRLIGYLKEKYPLFEWDEDGFRDVAFKTQALLYRILREVFPGQAIQQNYEHPTLKHPDSSQNMTFDVFLPELKLAVEYQGVHHYYSTHFFGSAAPQQLRDEEKRQACLDRGITLIEIGYWWKFDKQSVIESIRKYRPDLASRLPPPSPHARPVSEHPPEELFEEGENVGNEDTFVAKSLDQLRNEFREQEDYVKELGAEDFWNLFRKIYGVHRSTVKHWIERGYRTFDDLKDAKHLTEANKIGIKYYDEFLRSIPREEVQEIEARVREIVTTLYPSIELVVAGSFRRGSATSSDVDFLLIIDHNENYPSTREILETLVSRLKTRNLITDDLHAVKTSTYRGVFRLPKSESLHRKIDLK
eukprot:TRINITY_DN8211_c0_g1_i1.p1 TRINITY_DN8211_c0_g1~~TRINITY_DN8211_c0_g1_i1.p1  ORF type:complete len:678 (+),score=129.47 TRINITY_DN8211_c0_g1_i1:83-2116(+)